MLENSTVCYSAYAARDARFDGVFFIGVTSTGIYCRPICTARTPKAANCRFFDSAAAAEKANFRPCLRCRPELAPGNAPVDDARRIAALVARRIEEGMADGDAGRAGLERIAAKFGWSSRQIRRMVQKELGVSPIELVQTRRLLLAKQLLTETSLPVARVAYASGFASLRRFNDAFNKRYGLAPSRFRRAADDVAAAPRTGASLVLRLAYRTPFDWRAMLDFLGARAIAGVESIDGDAYARTVALGDRTGWIRVSNGAGEHALTVEASESLVPVLPALLGRLRQLFDLDARPDIIADHLAADARLRPLVAAAPGLRVPGAFDGFELALRAILGQQITVKAATTIASRVITAFGDSIDTARDALTRITPPAARLAEAQVDDVASLGIVRTRAATIVALAREVAAGRLVLEPGADPDATIAQLVALPGIGAWTANYIALRALRWTDAFPKEDVVLRKQLGGV
ncbi:MAG TPA: AlkA N-terminal domain-containing protein, partial [Gemmatimonadaceae bacterium]|nr:AlkA N-terminal domain-containing protein [Gemmatimonadaceae bacterium]